MANHILRRKMRMEQATRPAKPEPKVKVRNLTGVGQWHGAYCLPADPQVWTPLPKSLALRLANEPQNYQIGDTKRTAASDVQGREQWKLWENHNRPPIASVLLSIVVLGHNQYEYTDKCVRSIYAHTGCRFEIIFVDNGSADATTQIPTAFPRVRYFRSDTNLGVAGGRNFGMKEVKGEVICILDNDIEVVPGWDSRLLSALGSAPDIGMVGTHGCMMGDRWAEFPLVQRDCIRECQLLIGQTQMFWSDILGHVGTMDDSMVWHEDTEFSHRVLRAGYRLLSVPFDMPHKAGVTTKAVRKESFHDRWAVDARYMQEKLSDGNEVCVYRSEGQTGSMEAIASDAVDALRSFGYTVFRRASIGYDFHPLAVSTSFQLVMGGRRLGTFVVENDRVPRKYAAGFDVDVNLCMSDHALEALVDSGVPRRKLIRCDLNAVDTNVFRPALSPRQSKPFRFLWVGSSQPRKGIDLLLKAFGTAFTCGDNVELVLKDGIYGQRENTAKMIARHPLASKIKHIWNDTSEEELADIYRSASYDQGAFVHPHRGEGFGRTPLEAAICGCRIGMTGWSATNEYADNRTMTLFPFEMKRSTFHNHPGEPYFEPGEKQPQWAEANVDAISEWMRDMFTIPCDKADLRDVSRLLSEKYSKEAVAYRFINTIQALAGEKYKFLRHQKDKTNLWSECVQVPDALIDVLQRQSGRNIRILKSWGPDSRFSPGKKYDLIFSQDVLEHLAPASVRDNLRKMNALKRNGQVCVVIDTIENPDMCADPTHRTFRSEKWWQKEFGAIFTECPVPESVIAQFPARLVLIGMTQKNRP